MAWLVDKLTDTLAKRLFLLIWAALVASHMAAFAAVMVIHFSQDWPGAAVLPPELPTFPSLPPTPGMPDVRQRAFGPGPGFDPDGEGEGEPRPGPRSLPLNILLLDYAVRLLVIALAAWFGARWVAAPMRRLAVASRALGDSLHGRPTEATPSLDEHTGTREVRDAAQVFNTMARQLREQFRARGLMVAAISHDLRTPLTRLRMRLESMDADTDLQQRAVGDLREMNALIDNVLEVFRNDGGAGSAEPLQKTDVAALLQSITDDLIEQGQAVSLAGLASAVTLAQPAALQRVLGNIIGNALRYGGRAELRIEQTEAELLIVIDDAGPGIPEAHLDDVFQPFFRVESSRNQHTGGTGLGLYIARDLMQRQGGRLSLSNRREGGLRVGLGLPRR